METEVAIALIGAMVSVATLVVNGVIAIRVGTVRTEVSSVRLDVAKVHELTNSNFTSQSNRLDEGTEEQKRLTSEIARLNALVVEKQRQIPNISVTEGIVKSLGEDKKDVDPDR